MDKVERWSRVGIIYHLELPEGEIFVSTNELYLSLVIENLLDNANKFTDSGSITLKMRLDKAQSKLRIEVTDKLWHSSRKTGGNISVFYQTG
ncbi:hypothetical protein NXW27_10025 [Phocaeicola dorei]|nr:hypothetical protein [Phocaeicola dorei]